MNCNTLRKKYNEWNKLSICDITYRNSLDKYLKTTCIMKELKYQSIDTVSEKAGQSAVSSSPSKNKDRVESTFVEDANGSQEASYYSIHGRHKNKSSKGIKITNGNPLSINLDAANKPCP